MSAELDETDWGDRMLLDLMRSKVVQVADGVDDGAMIRGGDPQ